MKFVFEENDLILTEEIQSRDERFIICWLTGEEYGLLRLSDGYIIRKQKTELVHFINNLDCVPSMKLLKKIIVPTDGSGQEK